MVPRSIYRALLSGLLALAAMAGIGTATAAATPMNVMVPAYSDPGEEAGSRIWATLATQSAVIPNRLVAIADVDEVGPGPVRLAQYTTAIENMHRSTGRVLGYVETFGGTSRLEVVRALIDLWYSFYPTIDGIFFDEMAYTRGREAYYQSLYNYVKGRRASALVIGNAGIETVAEYLFFGGRRVIDAISIFETETGATTWRAPAWYFRYERSNFYALPFNVSSANYRAAIANAYAQNAGWFYATDDRGANPWDTLATYFVSEVRHIREFYS